MGFAGPAVVRVTRTLAAEDAVRSISREACDLQVCPGVCRREQAAISALLQADHRCADLGARQRRCDGEQRQEELIRVARRGQRDRGGCAHLRRAVDASPGAASSLAVRQQGFAGWHRITLAIGTARGPDLAGRSGAKAPCACPSIGGRPPLPCHLGRQGACPICDAGEDGAPRSSPHWQARTSGPGVKIAHPAREVLRGVQSVAHLTLPGFSARSQVALLDLAF